jgi:hypothetical protein
VVTAAASAAIAVRAGPATMTLRMRSKNNG